MRGRGLGQKVLVEEKKTIPTTRSRGEILTIPSVSSREIV